MASELQRLSAALAARMQELGCAPTVSSVVDLLRVATRGRPYKRGQGAGHGSAALCFVAGVTRQIVLPTSSATRTAPALSTATPTGRP